MTGWPKPNKGLPTRDSVFCLGPGLVCGPGEGGWACLGLPWAGRWPESLPHMGPHQARVPFFGPFQLSEWSPFLMSPHFPSSHRLNFYSLSYDGFSLFWESMSGLTPGQWQNRVEIKMKLHSCHFTEDTAEPQAKKTVLSRRPHVPPL